MGAKRTPPWYTSVKRYVGTNRVEINWYLPTYIRRHISTPLKKPSPNWTTLEFLINVPVRLLIFEQFSHQYALIRTSTFIFYEQLMILYTCTWPIFMRNYIFEAIILHQYAYLDQYVYWIWQNFPPVLLFGPVRLLGTLE